MSLDTKPDHDIEMRFLEDLFEHEAQCESEHAVNGDVCSDKVEFLGLTRCGPKRLLCRNAANNAQRAIDSHWESCFYCGDRLEKCWTITPI